MKSLSLAGGGILFLSCLWPFLHLMSANTDVLFHFNSIISYGGYVFGFSSVLYLLSLLFLKKTSPIKSASVIGFSVLLTFSFGAINTLYESLLGPENHSGKATIITLALLIIVTLIAIKKSKGDISTSRFVFIILAILNIGPFIQLSLAAPDLLRQANLGSTHKSQETGPVTTQRQNAHNVYYFVFDAYARKDILKQYFDFDNTPFLEQINSLGYQVSSQSLSNYGTTYRTISTTFNMDYYIKETSEYDVNILQNGGHAIQRFKELGYRFLYVESGGVAAVTCGSQVDFCVKGSRLDQVGRTLMTMTPMWRIVHSTLFLNIFNIEGIYALSEVIPALDAVLKNGQAHQAPYVAFIHILSPHEPARYNKQCERLGVLDPTFADDKNPNGAQQERRTSYTQDLKCLNPRILKTLKMINEQDSSDPIVFLQSDHGVRHDLVIEDPQQIVRLKNLVATKLPQDCQQWFPAHLTPVNNFRFALNCVQNGGTQYVPNRFFQIDLPEKKHVTEYTNEALATWQSN